MRVIICGAGIAGLSLAWWLGRGGHEVLIVERAPDLRDDGYMIDFFGSGYDAAQRMGLLPRLKAIHLNFMRGDLARVLFEALPMGVQVRFGCTVDAVEQSDGQAVSLLAGQGASLAMGAAYVLAQELQSEGSLGERLARYEAALKPAIARKQAAGRRAARWIVPSSRWRIAARNFALRLASLPGLGGLLRPVLASESDSVIADTPALPRP